MLIGRLCRVSIYRVFSMPIKRGIEVRSSTACARGFARRFATCYSVALLKIENTSGIQGKFSGVISITSRGPRTPMRK